MLQRLRARYAELTDPNLYRLYGLPPGPAKCCAAAAAGALVGVPLGLVTYVVLQLLVGCTPAQRQVLGGVGSLLQAAAQMHDVADEASVQPTREASQEILEEQLPDVLQSMDEALAELCAPEGLLEADSRVCRHYHAYKADPVD